MHDPRLGMVSMKPLSVLLLAIPFIKPIYDTFSMVCQSTYWKSRKVCCRLVFLEKKSSRVYKKVIFLQTCCIKYDFNMDSNLALLLSISEKRLNGIFTRVLDQSRLDRSIPSPDSLVTITI